MLLPELPALLSQWLKLASWLEWPPLLLHREEVELERALHMSRPESSDLGELDLEPSGEL